MKHPQIYINWSELDLETKTPILDYCRKLIKDGHNPQTKAYFYRDFEKEADIKINHIGLAATLTVKNTRFKLLKQARRGVPQPR